MPEGDTVHRTATVQHLALAGRTLEAAELRVPKWATAELAGLTVEAVVARGKHLVHRVGPFSLHSHLKMEGSWRTFAVHADGSFERWTKPWHTARAVLTTNVVQSVGFDLGVVELVDRGAEEALFEHLGPDLLDEAWGEALRAEAIARLESEPEIPVFVAILDQRKVAGVGNVYANELAFVRGVLPTRPIGDVDVPALVDLARRMLVANVGRWTRSTTGDLRPRERTWVYGRHAARCRRCQAPLRHGRLGPDLAPEVPDQDRDVTWCPRCQV